MLTRPAPQVFLVIALAPLSWFTHLAVSYALVPWSCRVGTDLPMHITTVVALAGLLTASSISVRVVRRGDRGAPAIAAAALAVYFAFVVVMTGLVPVVVDRCA